MDRRNFIKSGALIGFSPSIVPFNKNADLTKPDPLQKGATIGLIAPASALSRSAFEKTILNIESLGFKVSHSDNLRTRNGFLSGTDKQRIDDIHNMFSNPNISAIICARGGYGTTRLLDGLD